MVDAHKNFAVSLVATAPSPATTGTSLVVTAGQGALFPAVPFNAVIWPAGAAPLSTNAEIVRVTAIATDTFTITRIQESTSARTVVVGDQIAAAITALTLTDVENALARDTLWDAAGDLVVGSGANTAARLAVGSGGFLLKSDGTNPSWQAFTTYMTAQAEQETGTDQNAFVSPGLQKFHPSATKFWVKAGITGNVLASYNVTSVTDTGTGALTVTIATDFSSADWSCVGAIGLASTTLAQSCTYDSMAAGTVVMRSVVEAGSAADPVTWSVQGMGDQ